MDTVIFEPGRALVLRAALHAPPETRARFGVTIRTENDSRDVGSRKLVGVEDVQLEIPLLPEESELVFALDVVGPARSAFSLRLAILQDGSALVDEELSGTLADGSYQIERRFLFQTLEAVDHIDYIVPRGEPPPPPTIEAADDIDYIVPHGEPPPPPPHPGPRESANRRLNRARPPRVGDLLVHYGTNRRPKDLADASQGFSSDRDTVVHYGTCTVHVPQSHRIGSMGSPWWTRWWTGEDDRLTLNEVRDKPETDFWGDIGAALAQLEPADRDAVVFVHGFNVSFEEAALRAAQIGADLGVNGAMAFYSWPSKGEFLDYSADEATIEASEGFITGFLEGFLIRSGAERVHVIAHSMGNRGVIRAFDRIAHNVGTHYPGRFGQVILAAADIDVDTFRRLAGAYGQLAQRATLYVSTRDWAVEASEWKHRYPRAGLTPPVLVMPGIDTVSVANVDMSLLGHGYFANARGVLGDIQRLLTGNDPPERRFGLGEVDLPDGLKYWLMKA